MPDVGEMLPRGDCIPFGDADGAGLCMGDDRIAVHGLKNDIVAGQGAIVDHVLVVERASVPERDGEVSNGVHRISFGPAVLSDNNGRVRRGVDGPAPAIALVQADAQQKIAQEAGSIESRFTGSRVYADQVVGVRLTKYIGSVAWDPPTRCVGGDPFTPEGKLDDDRCRHG